MKKLISIRNAAAMVIMFVAGTFTAFADAPTNDNFSNAEILAGTRLSITRTNVGATKETLEPDHAGNQGGRSVWFRWVAPSSGTVLFSTNRSTSQIDTLLAVYTGNGFDNLQPMGTSDNVNPLNRRSFLKSRVTGGLTYYIAIDGFNDGQTISSGEFALNIHYSQGHQGADYDPDGITDLAVYRPSNNTFYIFGSGYSTMSIVKWGTTGDIPLIAERTGFRSNPFVFRPSTGAWYGNNCCGPALLAFTWGTAGDIPVPEFYGGEQLPVRMAVFRPSTGTWYIQGEGAGADRIYQFGLNGDIPLPGRYTQDGVADIAVYRPSTGVWYFIQRHSISPIQDTFAAIQFGQPGDKPVPGDYDGDGLLDVAVYRPSTGEWWVLQSGNSQQRVTKWGIAEDIPTTGDFDGDGLFDRAVFRPSNGNWYIFESGSQQARIQHFGTTGDIPMTSNVK